MKKIVRKIVACAVYIPPETQKPSLDALGKALSDDVAAIKIKYKDPIVVLGGDFNRRDLVAALRDAEDMAALNTSPTRGEGFLDIVYTNVPGSVTESGVVPPLASDSGVSSNHRCVHGEIFMPPKRNFNWVVKMVRKRSRKADEASCREIRSLDWSEVEAAEGVDNKAEALERTIEALTDRHFPMIRTRRRSNEPPLITHKIRRLLKKKCRIYKKEGRSQAWWATDHIMQALIAESRQEFVDKALEDGNSGKPFYAAAKALALPGGTQSWSVSDLFPGSSPGEICDTVLGYFSGVGGDSLR